VCVRVTLVFLRKFVVFRTLLALRPAREKKNTHRCKYMITKFIHFIYELRENSGTIYNGYTVLHNKKGRSAFGFYTSFFDTDTYINMHILSFHAKQKRALTVAIRGIIQVNAKREIHAVFSIYLTLYAADLPSYTRTKKQKIYIRSQFLYSFLYSCVLIV